MADAKPLGVRIAERAETALGWVRSITLHIKLWMILGGAFLGGVAKYLPLEKSPFDLQALIGTVGAVLAFLGGLALLFLDKSMAGSAAEAAEAFSELQTVQAQAARLGTMIEALQGRDQRARALHAAGTTLLQALEGALASGALDLDQILENLLDVGMAELQLAMGFMPDEHWTISVYRATGRQKILRRVVTRRSFRAEERSSSRDWRPGEGHVGTTFARKLEVVLSDVTDPKFAPLLNTPVGKNRATDGERYRSIAAVPIPRTGTRDPWGVVIATNSGPGKFDPTPVNEGWERAEPMRLFADVIALAVGAEHILTGGARRS